MSIPIPLNVLEILNDGVPIYTIIGPDKTSKYRNVKYFDVFGAFDIETTSYFKGEKKLATMYLWQFSVNHVFIYGRKWEEFIRLMGLIHDEYGTSEELRFVVYVHNLFYEFNFLHKYFDWHMVFAREEGSPIRAVTTSGIEFRCSYMLAGKSLRSLCDDYNLPTKKEHLDYSKLRFWWTELDQDELSYARADVYAVEEYIQTQIKRCGSIARIPYTRTSYVRQAVCDACYGDRNDGKKYLNFIRNLRILSPDNYKSLKRAYQGGFTHANSWRVGRTYSNVGSYDLTSSYPAVMCSELYPMSTPDFYEEMSKECYLSMINHYAIIADITFECLESKTEVDNILSASKCTSLLNARLDNGRIDYCDSCTVTLTEVDFKLVLLYYNVGDWKAENCYVYTLAYLPKPIIETVLDAYGKKTELKGVVGRELDYLIGKENNNSIYGMTVTDIVQDNVTYREHEWATNTPHIEDALSMYHNARRRTLYYPWGVYVTAYARNNLLRTMLEVGTDYIYADTDSIKLLHPEKHDAVFTDYNRRIARKLRACLNYCDIPVDRSIPLDIKGRPHPLGAWDNEGVYDRFKAMRAKCYLTETKGKLRITVAGCNKDGGSDYLAMFEDPFAVFDWDLDIPPEYAHRMTATYISDPTSDTVADYRGKVGTWREESSVVLIPTAYHLNQTKEFADFLRIFRMGVDNPY